MYRNNTQCLLVQQCLYNNGVHFKEELTSRLLYDNIFIKFSSTSNECSAYLVSDLWLSTSLQVLGMVWHSEFHAAVFICNNSFLTFLNRTTNQHYLFSKEHHQCLIQLLPTRADCHQCCTRFSTNQVKATNVSTDSLR